MSNFSSNFMEPQSVLKALSTKENEMLKPMLLNDVKQCIKGRMNEHQGNAKDKDRYVGKYIFR